MNKTFLTIVLSVIFTAVIFTAAVFVAVGIKQAEERDADFRQCMTVMGVYSGRMAAEDIAYVTAGCRLYAENQN